MKKTLPTFFLIFCATLYCCAQESHNPAPYQIHMEAAGDALRSQIIPVPCAGSMNTPSADLNWKPGLAHIVHESEPLEPNHEQLERIREELTQHKLQNQSKDNAPSQSKSMNTVTPTIGIQYNANRNNGWMPLDNNIAISNNGIIVSVANDTFEVDDSTGTNLYYNTLNTFINDNTIPNACDPVILYDMRADRFIFYCQEVTNTANTPNHMMLFFSKTNNPATGGWWKFILSGNPLNDGSDADYPKIGITDNDLYLSSNLFLNGNFNTAIVWQIEKSQGYSGGTLNTHLWSNLTGSPFTILPVSEGQGHSYGPGIWMVATSSSGSSNIDLYQVTNDVGATPAPTMVHHSISTNAYTAAGNTMQMGTSTQLQITDARALSGFYLNGIIHFVNNVNDAGNNAICYNRLDVNALTNTASNYTAPNVDYNYPAVASYAVTSTDKSVMIGYVAGSSNLYPEISVVNCDNAMNWSSPVIVKTGTYVSSSSGTARCGDYSGMCRKHNSLQPCVWMAGAFGNTSHSWDAYVAQIYDNTYVTGVPEHVSGMTNIKTFPNPVQDMFSLNFSMDKDARIDIAVYDVQGRMVKSLYSGWCHEGENNFSFNKSNLSSGVYYLQIKSEGNNIQNEKIVVAD
jgi:hypothetical protein